MNREMRRLQEREERRRKKEEAKGSRSQRKASALQSKSSGERKSFFNRVRDYLHEVRQELRKVTWPTREQMIAFTTVTVITSAALTAVIFGLDVAAKEAILWLVELRG